SWIMERAKRGRIGSYMSLYTMTFGFSHVFGHFTGMRLIEKHGYNLTWTVMSSLMLICMLMLFWVKRRDEKGK
ncbi:MAG: MFS transporter, partial [Flavobacteriales bacterium]